jgi:neutral ceramidase
LLGTFVSLFVESVRSGSHVCTGRTAAGTVDGFGLWPYVQGITKSWENPVVSLIGEIIAPASEETEEGQKPKPIMIACESIRLKHGPYLPDAWPLQVFRIGSIFILGVPGEFTTMAGRRLREHVENALSQYIKEKPIVLIAGLSNAYAHYVTTREEYQLQRYEGASNLHGQHSLAGFIQEYSILCSMLVGGKIRRTRTEAEKYPTDPFSSTSNTIPKLRFDTAPNRAGFGGIHEDCNSRYTPGDTASVEFFGANPRNNLRTGGTYLAVEFRKQDNSWTAIAHDSNWETELHWDDQGYDSIITIKWRIPQNVTFGQYRIRYFGTARSETGKLNEFVGTSSTFTVDREKNHKACFIL